MLAGGLLLSACSAAAAQEDRQAAQEVPPAWTNDGLHSWNGARLEKPGSRRLIVHFWGGGPPDAPVGPCNPRYVGTAELTGGVMTVTVRADRQPSDASVPCTAVAYERTVTVELPAALEGDTVVDGASGETRPVFDVTALRTPAYLPAGYEFLGESFEEGDPSTNRRTWQAGEGRSLTVAVRDRDPLPFEPNDSTVVLAETEINGQPATVWKTEGFDDNVTVSWIERGHGIEVSSIGSPTAPLSVDELLRVARSLA